MCELLDKNARTVSEQIRNVFSGLGAFVLDDIEKIAWVLGMKVVELFLSSGRTAAERVILALLEGSR